MSLHSAPLLSFDFFPSRPVEIEVSSAPLTSDAGLLPIRQFDENIRLTEQFAAALDDRRDPRFTRAVALEHGAATDLRHPRRLRGPERPRHPPIRSRLQAHRRSAPRRPRPRQSADPLAV